MTLTVEFYHHPLIMRPRLTVLLATLNGADVLPRTLEGYCRIRPPAGPWQLIVVDNGSSDSTPTILSSFAARLPVGIIRHPTPGKNRAMNAGLAAVQGELLVLTDDDAVPDPSFLRAWEQVLDVHRDFELFGGRIEPLFEGPPPHWLAESPYLLAMMFAKRDLPEGPVAPGDIYGPNMAVRTSVLERGHRFAEGIGPDGSDPNYPMGSESEFCRRVARTGVKSWFTRGALVHHIVRPHQCTKEALIRRAYRNGRGRAHLLWEEGPLARGPRLRLLDRLALLSPSEAHRMHALSLHHLARGFRDEVARRRAQGVPPAPGDTSR